MIAYASLSPLESGKTIKDDAVKGNNWPGFPLTEDQIVLSALDMHRGFMS